MERDYLTLAQAEQAYTVKLRRYFHQHPEVGPAEQVETMAAICRELETLEIPYERVPGGGILGFLGDPARGKTVLLRADIDALPIQEDPDNLKGPRVCISRESCTPADMMGISPCCSPRPKSSSPWSQS